MAIKLIVPVNGPITQLFGENPDIYKKWGYAGHNGIEYGIPNGTPVGAAVSGTVATAITSRSSTQTEVNPISHIMRTLQVSQLARGKR